MATFILAIGSYASDSTAKRRLAERLEQVRGDDYLLWHNVAIAPKQTCRNFVVLSARQKQCISKSICTQAQSRTTTLNSSYHNMRQIHLCGGDAGYSELVITHSAKGQFFKLLSD